MHVGSVAVQEDDSNAVERQLLYSPSPSEPSKTFYQTGRREQWIRGLTAQVGRSGGKSQAGEDMISHLQHENVDQGVDDPLLDARRLSVNHTRIFGASMRDRLLPKPPTQSIERMGEFCPAIHRNHPTREPKYQLLDDHHSPVHLIFLAMPWFCVSNDERSLGRRKKPGLYSGPDVIHP